MTLHITDFPDEVIREARVACIRSGEGLRAFLVRAINSQLASKFEIKAEVPRETSDKPLKVDSRPSEEILAEAQKRIDERKKLEPTVVPLMKKASGHDTKDCQLYGCLLCKDAGVKNPVRGL